MTPTSPPTSPQRANQRAHQRAQTCPSILDMPSSKTDPYEPDWSLAHLEHKLGKFWRFSSMKASSLPAKVKVAAASALRPPDGLVGVLGGKAHSAQIAKEAQGCLTSVVGNRHDLARAGVDLEAGRRRSNDPLVEPTVELELQCDLGVVVIVDAPGQLGVSDPISTAIADQEVRLAHEFASLAVEVDGCAEPSLVDRHSAGADGRQGVSLTCFIVSRGKVNDFRKRPRNVSMRVRQIRFAFSDSPV
jgi:hypothetical protein